MSCHAVVPLEGFEDVVRVLIPSLASLFQIPGSLLDALCGVEHVLLIQMQIAQSHKSHHSCQELKWPHGYCSRKPTYVVHLTHEARYEQHV